MFDIDGTLVDCADGEWYATAVRNVLGIEVDTTWSSYRHVTDSGILDEILERGGFERAAAPALRACVAREFVTLVQRETAQGALAVREIPGARRLVETLEATPGVRVAIATGGWRPTAEIKLRAIGIEPAGRVVATADDALARTAIMRLAAAQALGATVPLRRTYFGDAEWDRRASRALGYDFVGVGRRVEHPARFDDLADTAAILAHLGV